MVITFVVLLFLNIYCSRASQRLFYLSKEASMVEKCLLAADEISLLDVINPSTVAEAVERMGSLQVSRLLDPAFQYVERPLDKDADSIKIQTFNGYAQVIIQKK